MMSEIKTFSDDLKFVNPQAHDENLVINKKVKTLESLRSSFKPSQSSVLGQVKDFLPKLAAANVDLEKQAQIDPLSVNMEHLPHSDHYVQMNLALMEHDEDDSDTSCSSESDEDLVIGEVTEDNIKLPTTHKHSGKILIQTCNDSDKTKDSGKPDNASYKGEMDTESVNT